MVGLGLAALLLVYAYRGLDAARGDTVHQVRLDGFRLQDLDGVQRHLAEWSGRPLLLNFWASWCKPCAKEMPLLTRLDARYPQVAFIGVAIDDVAAVSNFLETHAVGYTILVGEFDAMQFAAAVGNGIAAVPYTVVLDSSGTLVYQQAGVFDPHELEATLAGLHVSLP